MFLSKIKRSFFLVILFSIVTQVALAQDESGTRWYNDPLDFSPLYLSRGTGFAWGAGFSLLAVLLSKKKISKEERISKYASIGYAYGYNKPYTDVYMAQYGVTYAVRKNIKFGLALHPLYFDRPQESTFSVGPRIFTNWYLINKEKFGLYFQYGAGAVWNFNEFPNINSNNSRQGTHFNFTPAYEIGVETKIKEGVKLLISIRHQHLSNAELFGKDRNPGFDANGITIGIVY